MLCTSPIKAWLLNKQKMYEFIHQHELFCGNYSEFVNEIVEEETLLEYEKPAIESKTAHFFKRITFKPPKNYYSNCYDLIEIPCGHCDACLLNRSSEWGLRCYLESLYHTENCFITLTYNPENLPNNRTLVKSDLQKFWKRLRKFLDARQGGKKVRYLACGEYGPKHLRPHYHAAIFGYMPEDIKFYKYNHQKDPLFTSETLEKIWGKGFVIIGELTYESCSYVARYTTKKLKRQFKAKHNREQEFIVMSRKPAIGTAYFEEHEKEIWEENGIYQKTSKGVYLKPIPKIFKKKYKQKYDIGIENKYTLRQNESAKKIKEQWEEILSNTDLNREEYLEKLAETNKIKLKQLKRDNFENNA